VYGAYAGRRANGTPIQIRQTFHGGSRAADKALAKLVADASKEPATGVETVGDLLTEWLDHRVLADPVPGRHRPR
jgi:hypothetical protein